LIFFIKPNLSNFFSLHHSNRYCWYYKCWKLTLQYSFWCCY